MSLLHTKTHTYDHRHNHTHQSFSHLVSSECWLLSSPKLSTPLLSFLSFPTNPFVFFRLLLSFWCLRLLVFFSQEGSVWHWMSHPRLHKFVCVSTKNEHFASKHTHLYTVQQARLRFTHSNSKCFLSCC